MPQCHQLPLPTPEAVNRTATSSRISRLTSSSRCREFSPARIEGTTKMANPFLAEIRMFAGNFAPTGWALCNGQLLSISQNTALFSLLGTTYGGDGISTFALPHLQGRVPIHAGQGAGLSPYTQGQASGSENVTLIVTQMPVH